MNFNATYRQHPRNIFKDGYTTDDITYRWKNTDPVQIAKGLNLPRFSVEKYASRYCNVKTNTGKHINHACMRIIFHCNEH